MKFFVTGVPDAKSKIDSLIRTFIQSPLTVDSSQEDGVAIISPRGKRITIEIHYKYVSIDFGFGGELLEFNNYAKDEKKYFKGIMEFVLGIISEEQVSVEYKQLWMKVDEIIPIGELEDYRKRKEFKCVSWKGKHDYPK